MQKHLPRGRSSPPATPSLLLSRLSFRLRPLLPCTYPPIFPPPATPFLLLSRLSFRRRRRSCFSLRRQIRKNRLTNLSEIDIILRHVKQTFHKFDQTWRSRVAWSSAHDWKSCKPQKGFESSNLSFSAKTRRPCVYGFFIVPEALVIQLFLQWDGKFRQGGRDVQSLSGR